MKLPLLFPLVALGFSLSAFADDPVYDITPASTSQFFNVWCLAGNQGPEEIKGFVSIAYDNKGLILDIDGLKGTESAAEPASKDPNKWNSVEILFGAQKGSGQYYQAIINTDLDPASVTLIKDLRKPAAKTPPKITVKPTDHDGAAGYTVHLPWSDLGIEPKEGAEITLQIFINRIDAAGRRHTVAWHPEYRVHTSPDAMYTLRLAKKPSPSVWLATRATLDQGQPRVDVYSANADSVDKSIEVRSGDKVVATGIFTPGETPLHAAFILPKGATSVSSERAGEASIDTTNLSDLVTAAVLNIRPTFRPCVFSGTNFPPCDLETGLKPGESLVEIEKALGKCTLTPTFYDADYNEVKTASKPGRYGAIVKVETPGGLKFNRYVTLYRAPQELLGRNLRATFTGVEFPPELGIDPAVVAPHLRSIGAFFNSQPLTDASINRGPEMAVLLAWLSGLKPGATPDLLRDGPYPANQLWWYGLKKKTGNLRTDYFVHLPEGYDKDPSKKWPLILFLHGSGERGYDTNLVTRTGLPQDLDERKDFPFIVVAPQESPGEWWTIPEVKDLLAAVEAKYQVDPSRIYLTGLSMGGFGTWAIASAEPGLFAAIVPICGGGDPRDISTLKTLPIWAFHGAKDDAVPLERTQEMIDAINKADGNAKLTIFPEDGHNSWTDAYATPELYEWLLKQQKK